MTRKSYIWMLALMLTALAASCRRIPLYDEVSNLVVDIDIDYNLVNVSEPPVPELMQVGFYNPMSGAHISSDFTGPTGGPVNITPGIYDILVYNYDTEYTIVHNTKSINTIEAYTNRVGGSASSRYDDIRNSIIKARNAARANIPEIPASRQYDSEPLINQPDILYVGDVDQQYIPERQNENDVYHLHVVAHSLVKTYKLIIESVKGEEYIKNVYAYVTGQEESVRMIDDASTGESCSLYMNMDIDFDNNLLTQKFNTFGKEAGADHQAYVLLCILDKFGLQHLYEWDVTDQFDDVNNNELIIHIIDDIIIEEPTNPDGSLSPSVNLWEDHETILQM